LQTLVTPLTQTQIRATMVQALITLGIPANLWRSGGVASTLLTVAATVLAMASTLVAQAISGFFLPLASGTNLQLLAYYGYGVTPPAATFASGTLYLVNQGGGVYTVPTGGYTALNPATGQTYATTAGFSLGAVGSPTATVSVAAQCTVQGSIGSANPLSITTPVTNLLGVTVTNPAPFVGIDTITDAALRQLCLNALGAMSVRGPRTAYGYAVQTAINSVTGAPVNINRWTVTESSHVGQVTIYVASPQGAPSSADVAGVATNVEAVARPMGVTATVIPATVLNDTDAITVYCTAPTGTSATALVNAIEAALTSYFENYPIGGLTATDDLGTFTGLFSGGIAGAIGVALQANGATLISVQGANDYGLSATQVPVDETSVTIRILALPSGTTVTT
jgi:hypothetical protein